MTAGKKVKYYGKKLLAFLLSVLALSLLVFYLARLAPGDPLVAYYGERTEKMSVEERERSLERLGLNDPIYVQYVRWVENAAQGDFGISYQYKQPVLAVLEGRMGNTVLLGGVGFVLTFVLALLLVFMLVPIVLTMLGQFDLITNMVDDSAMARVFYKLNLLISIAA